MPQIFGQIFVAPPQSFAWIATPCEIADASVNIANRKENTEPDSPSWLNDGPATITPMPRDIQEFSASERGAYNLGVTDERLRRARLI